MAGFKFYFMHIKCFIIKNCNNTCFHSFLRLVLVNIFAFYPIMLTGQEPDKSNVYLTGVIMDADTLNALPQSSIIIKNDTLLSGRKGFFSVAMHRGDTVIFKAQYYMESQFVIPDTLHYNRYLLGVFLSRNSQIFPEVIIVPWNEHEKGEKPWINHQNNKDFANTNTNLNLLKLQAESGNHDIELYSGPDISLSQFHNNIIYKGIYGPENAVMLSIPALIGMIYVMIGAKDNQELIEEKIYEELKKIKSEKSK